MDYGHPEFLSYRPWLVAYLALALALLLQQAWAQRGRIQAALAARFGPALSLPRCLLKWALLAAAWWQLLLALAVPLGEPIKVESESRGADVILAVDVSSSMYAQDLPPSRLAALKQALLGFLAKLAGEGGAGSAAATGDRVGLVAFAGEAVIACPLTTDLDTAALFLEKLETDSVPRDGTGLARALQLSLEGFAADPKRGRMIILATDGEDTLDSDTAAWARKAKELGIPVHTLGVGTPQGAMIPGRPDIFGRVRPKTWQGRPVISRLNTATLRRIAALSGGQYFDGSSPAALARAYEAARRLQQGPAKSPDRFVRDPLYQRPLRLALLLFILEMLLANRSGGLLRAARLVRNGLVALWRRRRAAAPLALWLLLCGFSLDPGRREYDQGNALYRQGKYAEAAQIYEQSLGLKPRAWTYYNLGNARFLQEDYQGAIQAYEEALKIDPQDADAKHNLELARRRLEQKEQQGSQTQPGQTPQRNRQDPQGRQGQQSQQSGQGQQSQQGRQGGQAKPGSPGKGGNQGNLNQDQIHAMMNMLRNDQRRFSGAFQPLQRYDNQPKSQDPFEELFEQMTGRPLRPREQEGGVERKDW